MTIDVNDDVFLSPFTLTDVERLVALLRDPSVSENTFIPYPYTISDAKDWVAFTEDQSRHLGACVNYAIRLKTGSLIGGIGLKPPARSFTRHRAEVGYWLAKEQRNQSIVSSALKVFSRVMMERFGYVKLFAPIFDFNVASQRAAEKAGYIYEAKLAKHYMKNGRYIDGVIYSLLRDE